MPETAMSLALVLADAHRSGRLVAAAGFREGAPA